jgi:cytochrome c-type biogenesis protein CcmH/NrfG
MDTQLISEIHWIEGALVVIAAALVFLVLVGFWILAAIVRAKLREPQISFSKQARRLLDRGESNKLIEVCEARLTEYPSDAEAWWYLAQAAYRSLQLKRALDAADKVTALRPDWPWIDQFVKAIEEQLSQQAPEPALQIVPPPPIVINVKPGNPFAAKDQKSAPSSNNEPTSDPRGN